MLSAYPNKGRTLLAGLIIVVLGVAGGIGVYLVAALAALVAGRPENADGVPSFGPLADLAVAFLTVAAVLPATLLAQRWIQRRPAVRLRWGLLLRCLPVAAVPVVLLSAVDGMPDEKMVGLAGFAPAVLVALLVVPVQAAAEEYLMRGWLLQAVHQWVRSPWPPIALQAVVFAALHGWGTPWGFADLVVFGLVAGWLTVRTGGLEAAIALHVANNLISVLLAAAYGELGVDQTAADMPWQYAVADAPLLLGYAAVIVMLTGRRDCLTLLPA
ncbi:CPBP family intramembrane glutamic endopeptidase [Winogradskya consettensis]|nr:CPBP family intramembrane glutamic endopeptidase [Actinoplanes consettensis]